MCWEVSCARTTAPAGRVGVSGTIAAAFRRLSPKSEDAPELGPSEAFLGCERTTHNRNCDVRAMPRLYATPAVSAHIARQAVSGPTFHGLDPPRYPSRLVLLQALGTTADIIQSATQRLDAATGDERGELVNAAPARLRRSCRLGSDRPTDGQDARAAPDLTSTCLAGWVKLARCSLPPSSQSGQVLCSSSGE